MWPLALCRYLSMYVFTYLYIGTYVHTYVPDGSVVLFFCLLRLFIVLFIECNYGP